MTEDEAKTKWCPFARVAYGEAGINRLWGSKEIDSDARCIGSDCMVWRTYDDDKQGYCGLAQPTRAVP